MQKRITIIVVVVLLIILAIFISNKNDKKDTTQDLPNKDAVQTTLEIPDSKYSILKDKSVIKWTGHKKILTDWIDKGTISIKSGELEIKDGKINTNQLVIDMNSIKADATGAGSGQDKLETHLKSDAFFDVVKYPEANFVIKEVKISEEVSKFNIEGDLTIKGITNAISIPVLFEMIGEEYKISGKVDIDRTLWDIKFGSSKFFQDLGDNVVDDIVNLEFEVYVKEV
jgi:polyisoprenoid-binding protein YceI